MSFDKPEAFRSLACLRTKGPCQRILASGITLRIVQIEAAELDEDIETITKKGLKETKEELIHLFRGEHLHERGHSSFDAVVKQQHSCQSEEVPACFDWKL